VAIAGEGSRGDRREAERQAWTWLEGKLGRSPFRHGCEPQQDHCPGVKARGSSGRGAASP